MEKICKICGEQIPDDGCGDYIDRTTYGVCDRCCYEHADVRTCYEYCKNEQAEQPININSFLFFMFSQDEIEEILLRELESTNAVSCRAFVEDDEYWFKEMIMKYDA